MVRGYQKRIIYLKRTNSKLFDEAYFVVKEDKAQRSAPESELIEEANRIIDENCPEASRGGFLLSERRRIKDRIFCILRAIALSVLPFCIGVLITSLVT